MINTFVTVLVNLLMLDTAVHHLFMLVHSVLSNVN